MQAQTPGSRDVLVFEEGDGARGAGGGIQHIGFRLQDPADIDAAVRAVEAAGGRVLRRGEFVPGEPYAFFADLDGYEVEIWYELSDVCSHRLFAGASRLRSEFRKSSYGGSGITSLPMLIPLVFALQLNATTPDVRIMDRASVAWRAGAPPYEVLLEESVASRHADPIHRIRVRVPGRRDFTVVDDRGLGPYVSGARGAAGRQPDSHSPHTG